VNEYVTGLYVPGSGYGIESAWILRPAPKTNANPTKAESFRAAGRENLKEMREPEVFTVLAP
jgi:hypothetical protein